MRRLTVVLLAVLVFAGCATNGRVNTRLSETVYDEAGNPQTTIYEASSKAGLFGEVNPSLHNLLYTWGGTENQIAIGQENEGISNAGQVEALKVQMAALVAITPEIKEAILQVMTRPEDGGALARLLQLLDAASRFLPP